MYDVSERAPTAERCFISALTEVERCVLPAMQHI